MIIGNQNYITREQASFTELIENQEAIILDLESLYYYSLNSSASLIWKCLRSGYASSVDAISKVVCETFNVQASSALPAVREFFEQLSEHGLISPAEGAVTGSTQFNLPKSLSNYETPALKLSANVGAQMNLAAGSSSGGPAALGGGG